MKSYIFVTGGVISSLGKGVTTASIGSILESMGQKISFLKFDPYLNIDPGTMNPTQHGEIFVTTDGAETDLDLGHYHRFTNATISAKSAVTSGKIYQNIINKERSGFYKGATIQIIPHVTDEIKRYILEASENCDITIIEVGGTVGDIESQPFLEAVRQFTKEHRSVNIHLGYLPYVLTAGEMKSKPIQQSIQTLQKSGIFPEIIICRSQEEINEKVKLKISNMCNVDKKRVISLKDEESVYEVPLALKKEGLDIELMDILDLPKKNVTLPLEKFVKKKNSITKVVSIVLIGKYLKNKDSYRSVEESILHATVENDVKVKVIPVECDGDSKEMESLIKSVDGAIIPGGFGERGWENIILSAKICREEEIPCFGICFGMQAIAVELGRNILRLPSCNSQEIDEDCKDPIIKREISLEKSLGGSLRLGLIDITIENSKTSKIYGSNKTSEIHRHRYTFNTHYSQSFEENGIRIAGRSDDNLVEIIEYPNHPWMIGVQFHPEFLSKPLSPHPLFTNFIAALK